LRVVPHRTGGNMIYLVGRRRVRADSVVPGKPRLTVACTVLQEPAKPDMNDISVRPPLLLTIRSLARSRPDARAQVHASVVELYRILKELVKYDPFFKEQLQHLLEMTDVSNPGELADSSSALTTAAGEKLQVRGVGVQRLARPPSVTHARRRRSSRRSTCPSACSRRSSSSARSST